MNILIIDDNTKLSSILKEFLELKNFNVTSSTGEDAIILIDDNEFDLYIIDIHLPTINGLDIVKFIRNKDLNSPIIMITSSDEEENFITAFKNGCNEFIKKPFHLSEIEIRINNLLNKKITNLINIDENISFDLLHQELFIDNQNINLRKKERRFLSIMLKNRGHNVTTNEIIEYVWENEEKENYPLRQLVSSLKKKVPQIKDYIKSVSGIGYRFK